MTKQLLLGPAHVVYLFVFSFYLLSSFYLLAVGILLLCYIHPNPLTSADNINCLPLYPLGTLAV